MWHVSSCSDVATLRTAIHLLLVIIAQCTPCPQIAPFLDGSGGSRLMLGFLGPHESTSQTTSRSVQPFSQDSRLFPTYRWTDSACVGKNRSHLMPCTAMRRCGVKVSALDSERRKLTSSSPGNAAFKSQLSISNWVLRPGWFDVAIRINCPSHDERVSLK